VYRAVLRPRGEEGLGVRQGWATSQEVRRERANTGLRRVATGVKGAAYTRLRRLQSDEEGLGIYRPVPPSRRGGVFGAAPHCK
jgi:hypothetical protein